MACCCSLAKRRDIWSLWLCNTYRHSASAEIGLEAVLRKAEVTGLKSRNRPHVPPKQPLDSQHSIQGTPTTRVLDHAHIQEASHHQRHTNPITEKEGVQASKRDLARRPTASQRAARARAVPQRPRRRHSVWQRINALSARATLPQGQKTLAGHKRHLHDLSLIHI